MTVQISKYKRTTWINKETNEPIYGVKVFVVGHGWADVATDGVPDLYTKKKDADAQIERMKAERDRSGWKLAKPAPRLPEPAL